MDGKASKLALYTGHHSSVVAPEVAMKIDTTALLPIIKDMFRIRSEEDSKLEVLQFTQGQSNPTYLIRINCSGAGGQQITCVLRKQPPGELLKSAHNIVREATILQKLQQFTLPIPRIHGIFNNRSVIGTPFVVMEHVDGVMFKEPRLLALKDAAGGATGGSTSKAQYYDAAVGALAAIHSVDVQSAGLIGAGAGAGAGVGAGAGSGAGSGSGSSHLARQVHTWTRQYGGSVQQLQQRKVQGEGLPHDPKVEALMNWLQNNIPPGDMDGSYDGCGPSVVHGDFKFDNIVFALSSRREPTPRVLAVLDWELAGVGHPLLDVAYFCMPYYIGLSGGGGRGGSGASAAAQSFLAAYALGDARAQQQVGVPPLTEVVGRYLQHLKGALRARGRSVEHLTRGIMSKPEALLVSPTWTFLVALNLFRMASIVAGVVARSLLGNASRGKAAAALLSDVPAVLVDAAMRVIDGSKHAASPASSTCINTRHAHLREQFHIQSADAAAISPTALEILHRVREFNTHAAIPHERRLIEHYQSAEGKWPVRGERWKVCETHKRLQGDARSKFGLWNMWMTRDLVSLLLDAHPHWDWKSLVPHCFASTTTKKSSLSGISHGIDTTRALTNLEYAYVAMETGRCVFTPFLLNCSAPDTGNMEIISRVGSAAQREYYLQALLLGETKSCFAMTEPAVASSDPTTLEATAERIRGEGVTRSGGEGEQHEHWRINGTKWWTSNAMHPDLSCCLFIARTTPRTEQKDAATGAKPAASARHQQHSLFIFPMQLPGITVVRPLVVFGHDDAPHGHGEVKFENIQLHYDSNGSCVGGLPVSPVMGTIGHGFAYAQLRLAPGRLHHCSRLVGHCQRAIEEVLVVGTPPPKGEVIKGGGKKHVAFGRNLLQLGGNLGKLGECSSAYTAARLCVLNAARELDQCTPSPSSASPGAHKLSKSCIMALSVAKVEAPAATSRCLDFAIQLHGGGGLSTDHPLAAMWIAARTLRIADGPDEVHLQTIAKALVRGSSGGRTASRSEVRPGVGKPRL